MKKQLEKRLTELKSEFTTGQKRLAELDAQRASLQETLLRISGAIQVLEEELGENSERGNGLPTQEEIAQSPKLVADDSLDKSE